MTDASIESIPTKMPSIATHPIVTKTEFPGASVLFRGKVRDMYKAGDALLMVATDRISAFDFVLGSGIPFKGEVLTQISIFWFGFLKDIVRNHFLSSDVAQYPEPFPQFTDILKGRSMLVKSVRAIPIECVVRGYISGSSWKEYQSEGRTVGVTLPKGLRESDRLSEPLFTPATKAESGHDENISFEEMASKIGSGLAQQLRDISMKLYQRAAAHAEEHAIILADTKFEFGQDDQGVLLIDEVLTPDSSRFWPRDTYHPGGPQSSLDKQYVRDYLETIGWNKQPPAPTLPVAVVEQTATKYLEIYRLLTGQQLN
ncbi:MAG: phosphoribosylaminoimidazolesuccinocarboxamide synthase [Acidobacteria bacterium]|nr:phosphoribosylaminoimidazolesuccinocarboxamide synthase [Acidobacteriota bacterium]